MSQSTYHKSGDLILTISSVEITDEEEKMHYAYLEQEPWLVSISMPGVINLRSVHLTHDIKHMVNHLDKTGWKKETT